MHEMSLLRDLIRKIDEIASAEGVAGAEGAESAEGVASVRRVTVRIGALAHISAAHFREHFEQAIVGHSAAGAELVVEVSEDQSDPLAQEIVLLSLEVDA